MTVSMVPEMRPAGQPSPPDDRDHGAGLRLVREQARSRVRRRRAVAGLAAFGFITCVLLFSVVAAHVNITQNQFRLERLQAQAIEEQADYERLRLQVAELESPGRIVKTAQDRLGMVQPAEVIYLSPDPTPSFAAPPASADQDERQSRAGSVAATNPAAGWQVVKPHLGER
jgi:cell division protein FtsL